jgi:hypothetical protein
VRIPSSKEHSSKRPSMHWFMHQTRVRGCPAKDARCRTVGPEEEDEEREVKVLPLV